MIDFAIIGAQKAATTYVHRLIESSEEIYIPRGEVRAFESPHYENGGVEKISQICISGAGKLTGVKRPDYLYRDEVISRLKENNPDIKLIAVLRDPVSRFISAYYHLMKLGFIPIKDLNLGIQSIFNGEYKSRYKKSEELLEYGLYGKWLSKYLEEYSSSQLLVLDQNDIKQEETLKNSLSSFLGVELLNSKPSAWVSNRGVYNLTRLSFLSYKNIFCYKYNSSNTIRWRRKNILSNAINGAFIGIDRILLEPLMGNKKARITKANEQRLLDFYREDQELLSRILAN